MWKKMLVILAVGVVAASVGLARSGSALASEKEPAAEAEAESAMEEGMVNVNTADQIDLEDLGLDAATAEAIIAYRTENGPFKTVEDLLQVKGMDQSKLDAIKGKITLE